MSKHESGDLSDTPNLIINPNSIPFQSMQQLLEWGRTQCKYYVDFLERGRRTKESLNRSIYGTISQEELLEEEKILSALIDRFIGSIPNSIERYPFNCLTWLEELSNHVRKGVHLSDAQKGNINTHLPSLIIKISEELSKPEKSVIGAEEKYMKMLSIMKFFQFERRDDVAGHLENTLFNLAEKFTKAFQDAQTHDPKTQDGKHLNIVYERKNIRNDVLDMIEGFVNFMMLVVGLPVADQEKIAISKELEKAYRDFVSKIIPGFFDQHLDSHPGTAEPHKEGENRAQTRLPPWVEHAKMGGLAPQ